MGSDRFPFSLTRTVYQRNNPDASLVTPTRALGFDNTIDVSALGASQDVIIKLDSGTAETKSVSLAAVVVDTAATVAELVTAFTTAAFTDMTFTADGDTGRFKAAYSGAGSPIYIQITDDGTTNTLVEVMLFGQGFGLKLLTKENLLSASAAANLKDKEEIETEDGNANITSVEFPAELKGLDPSVSHQVDDPELKAMMIGGTYTAADDEYLYPSQNATPPNVQLEVFQPVYAEGINKQADFVNIKRTRYYSGTAAPADVSADAKAWTAIIFNFSFPDYSDPTASDAKIGPAKETFLSIADYNAINWDTI